MASKLEFSADGKALDYFEVAPFTIDLTPATIVEAAASLPNPPSDADDAGRRFVARRQPRTSG